MAKITLFSQIFQRLPKDEIKKTIREHETDKHSKSFNTWTHFVVSFPSTDLSTFGDVLFFSRIEPVLDVLSFHLCTCAQHRHENRQKRVFLAVRVENGQLFFLKKDCFSMFSDGKKVS